MAREFTDTEIINKGEELFRADVENDELLSNYFRGFLSAQEVVDRLMALKIFAEGNAGEALRDGCEEDACEAADRTEVSA